MTTLITGVGAVGSHVAARLQEIGESLVLYDLNPNLDFLSTMFEVERTKVVVGDVNDIEGLVETVKREKIDRIVHLAGVLTRQLQDRPYLGIQLNILGTGSVLEVARLTGVSRVVFASTRGVNLMALPSPDGGPLDEDFEMRVLSNRPRTMYELSKLTGEFLGMLYHDTYGVDFAAIRLGGGFGPTPGPPSGLTGGVLRALVFNAALGRPVVIDDPSLTYRGRHEFVYFKDDAEAIVLACFKEKLKKRVFNIRMDRTYEYTEVVEIVHRLFPDVPIEVKSISNTSMSPGRAPREDFADTTAAREELGWKPKYDLEAGIA
ncbi:MAG TPA: NAD(P)-dependent oxidoreductase, partial [Chloroflexota bacterium]|nr:NAD(P)-dependent oxidoreductase [Chloroflexota bacterium]